MLKKLIVTLLFLSVFQTQARAHSLLLSAMDNEDGTITITGQFDTGATAQGAMVRLETPDGAEILFKQRLPEESELIVKIPERPYVIVLDGGPGHTVTRDGIAPAGGFKVPAGETAKNGASKPAPKKAGGAHGLSTAYVVCTLAAFCFMALTMVVCRRNTNRLLTELKQNR